MDEQGEQQLRESVGGPQVLGVTQPVQLGLHLSFTACCSLGYVVSF